MIEDLHEELSFEDWDTENKISLRYARKPEVEE
jgi:hypothetical protein